MLPARLSASAGQGTPPETRPRLTPLPLGRQCRSERSAHGFRLGADGRGDLARHNRPAWRAALARSSGRTFGAGEYQAIRLPWPLLRRPAVRRGAIREGPRYHREDAPGAQPSVKMRLHAPQYRQDRNDCCDRLRPACRLRPSDAIIPGATTRGRDGPFWAVLGGGRLHVAGNKLDTAPPPGRVAACRGASAEAASLV